MKIRYVCPFWYDVTLRDGNQALKKPWTPEEKKEIFWLLCSLGVDGIEIGFPGASKMDFECVAELAGIAPSGIVVGALARANQVDILAAIEALRSAKLAIPRIHTFIGMSPYHMSKVLKRSPQEVKETALRAIWLIKENVLDNCQIQFSPEHFGDCVENLDWLIETLQEIVRAGAKIINLPNTVERYRPEVFTAMVRRVIQAIGDKAQVAVHCHNDLGMATAATVESFFAGADQLEVALNGLGERAGNSNVYEVAMALHNNGITTGLNLEKIYETALRIAEMSGIPIPAKAAAIGSEVFKHRSGIHQDGAIKTEGQAKGAYRPYDPKIIGRADEEECEFTSQSGANAVMKIIKERGYLITKEEAKILQPALKVIAEEREAEMSITHGVLTSEELIRIYLAYKELTGKKILVEPADVMVLAKDIIGIGGEIAWRFKSIMGNTGNIASHVATVCLVDNNSKEFIEVATGDGPVDAAFNAIKKVVGFIPQLEDYQVDSVTKGGDAQGGVRVVLSAGEQKCEGWAADTDIIVASAKAYINAVNLLLRRKDK